MSLRALALIPLLALLGACATTQHPREREPMAELRVIAVPENALVEVNERSVGSARVLAQRPAKLKVGVKRVTLTAPGYFPHDLEVNLPKGETKLEITLRPVPR